MTKYLKKINQLANNLDISPINEKVRLINQTISLIKAKKIPQKRLPHLAFQPDELAELVNHFPKKRTEIVIINKLLENFRQYLSLEFGIWSLPNLTVAKLIKEQYQIKTALELMAGNALWSKALNEVGIDCLATDSFEWAKSSATGKKGYFPVKNLDAVSAIKEYPKFDLIICSWAPNFGKNDMAIINTWKKYSDGHLLFVGEKMGATNSPEFWYQAKFKHSKKLKTINRSFVSYDFIQEELFEIEK